MAVFTVIPDGDIDPESVIDTPLMTSLRDNPIAITEGAAGAPRVQNAALAGYPWGAGDIAANSLTAAELADAAVGQAQLKTATSTQSQAITTQGAITPTGGNYTTNWFLGSNNVAGYVKAVSEGSTAPTRYVFETTAATVYLPTRYIQASPPYDLGDGNIHKFVYALIDNVTSEVVATSIAADPPWAYHSSVNITPQRIDRRGRSFRFERLKPAAVESIKSIDEAMKLSITDRDLYMAWRRGETPVSEIEITTAYKNKGMPEVPHPFQVEDLPGRTVVMFDPMDSSIMLDIAALQDAGENVSELIHTNKFVIGNTALNRAAPPGVMPVAARWR